MIQKHYYVYNVNLVCLKKVFFQSYFMHGKYQVGYSHSCLTSFYPYGCSHKAWCGVAFEPRQRSPEADNLVLMKHMPAKLVF